QNGNWSSKRESADFFFSSRRRHTRSKRDWSSDVCSSDLLTEERLYLTAPWHTRELVDGCNDHAGAETVDLLVDDDYWKPTLLVRSEERRVGKECRCRWGTEEDKERHGRWIVLRVGRGRVV